MKILSALKSSLKISFVLLLLLMTFFPYNIDGMQNIYNQNVSPCVATDVNKEEENYKAMIVIESNSQRVLKSYNHDKRLPMASTTKIITAIMVIESAIDLDVRYALPIKSIGVEGSSMFLRKEEEFSLRELLYGLMLMSGNDSATALAMIVFGSEKEYVLQANAFVNRLGLQNTKIQNPHGLHDDEHYTTAHDLAKITAYAMKNSDFREIVATRQYDIKKTPTNEQRIMKNKNRILKDYDFANGVKTGFTPEAGRCLVASALKNNMELICVLLNSANMEEIGEKLLEETFSNYTMTQILPSHNHVSTISVNNSHTKEVNIYTKTGFTYPLSDLEKQLINIEYDYPMSINAPIDREQNIGKVSIKLSNQLLFEDNIYTIENAESNEYLYILRKVLQNFT